MAWRRRQHALVCDVAAPWEHGTAVRATAMPSYWDYNAVRVEDGDPGLDAAALAAAADDLQAGLTHRRIEVEDTAAGERLRPGFEALGWVVERLLWMFRPGPPPPMPRGVRERDHVATEALRAEWHGGEDWAGDQRAVLHFLGLEDHVAAARGSRAVMVEEDAYASFWCPPDAAAAEIEAVYVRPADRGRGLGAAVVRGALAAAGRDGAWIVADDEDRPKRLYARLGFEPAWVQHGFVRRPVAHRG